MLVMRVSTQLMTGLDTRKNSGLCNHVIDYTGCKRVSAYIAVAGVCGLVIRYPGFFHL
jgi:hypothetical protein